MQKRIRYQKLINKRFIRELYLILFFGAFSYLFGLITIYIPGLEGSESDFREIPLLISIFYISSPISLVAMSAITAVGAISIGSFWPTLIAHAVSLIISKYFYLYLKKQKIHISTIGLIWLMYIGIYYMLLLPVIILSNYIFGLNLGIDFISATKSFIYSARFEILFTAIITSLYLIQYKVQKQLKEHKNNLEHTVKERTEELETSNEELKSLNDELFEKSEIITNQNSELTTTLQHLKETQSHLVQAEKMVSLGILTAGVAHEINNPLNFIMGGYSGLENYFEDNETQAKEVKVFLSSIKTGISRATKIVKGLNQFSRTNDTFNDECDVHSIINNCLLMLQNQLKNKIKVSTKFDIKQSTVPGNEGKLHQVFINVLANSIQSISNQGSITVNTQIKEQNFIIKISDTGSGINKKHLSKITDPFFTTKDPGKGTGLGLSITYSIIKEHKGNLEFQSELDKGTTVIITLPLKNLQ